MSVKVVRLNRSLYRLKQASRSWHSDLISRMKGLGFEQCPTDACVFLLVERGTVTISAVVHVDDIFAVGRNEMFDCICEDFNRLVLINNPWGLTWYTGCHFTQDMENEFWTISQKALVEKLVGKFGMTRRSKVPAPSGVKLEEYEVDEPEGS